jgi:hypothetical protein
MSEREAPAETSAHSIEGEAFQSRVPVAAVSVMRRQE